MVTVICPKCKAELECEEGDLEAATACPQCGTPFIPADAVKPVAAPPPPPAPPRGGPAFSESPDVSAMQNATLIRELHAIADNQAKALAAQDRAEKLLAKLERYVRLFYLLTAASIVLFFVVFVLMILGKILGG